MITTTATDIQNNFGKYLKAVQEGNEIIILKKGKERRKNTKKLDIIQDAVVLLIKLTVTEQMGRNQNLTEIFQIYNMREQCFVEKTA